MELSIAHTDSREVEGVESRLPRFHVFDGACRIVIEAESQEDAPYLCSDMGWELICACDD